MKKFFILFAFIIFYYGCSEEATENIISTDKRIIKVTNTPDSATVYVEVTGRTANHGETVNLNLNSQFIRLRSEISEYVNGKGRFTVYAEGKVVFAKNLEILSPKETIFLSVVPEKIEIELLNYAGKSELYIYSDSD